MPENVKIVVVTSFTNKKYSKASPQLGDERYMPHAMFSLNYMPFLQNQGFHGDLENVNGHGKVMEHEQLGKSHGIL